nr:PTS sugar transporter subunit IIA [uncultured Erwinia sp.]
MAVSITWLCELNEGIHARPAGYIARLCNLFQAAIDWENTRTGLRANAKSALSLIASDTLLNDECRITLSGKDEQQAAARLRALLADLPTFSLHTEPVVSQGYLPRCLRELNPQVIQGTRLHQGVARARPQVMQSLTFADLIDRTPGQADGIGNETARFLAGLASLRGEKQRALRQTRGIEHDLIAAHLTLIDDGEFQEATIGYLNGGMNAWSAIVRVSLDVCEQLEKSSSHYLQERTLDLLDIATQLIGAAYGERALGHRPLLLTEPAIVFASHLTPSLLLALDRSRLVGLVLSSTGKTSHTAILARWLGIPTLADVDFTELTLDAERPVVIDAGSGILIVHPDENVLRYYRQEIAVQEEMQRLRVNTALGKDSARVGENPLLTAEMILWRMDARDKNEAIKMMVDNLWLQRRTDARDKLCDDIWAREVPFPTVVGSGFAIPHARTDAIHDSTLSVATLRQPIAWGGVMVDTLFMLTISQTAQDNAHMKHFSTLARMLMNDEFVSRIKQANGPEALYTLISRTLAC